MGKVLIIVGLVLLVFVGGIVGLLVWSHSKGEATHQAFFEAAFSGDPARLRSQFHPDLVEKVDEPVLGVWMASLKQHLGAFEGLSGGGFSTNSSTVNGVTRLETSGTVKFSKGEAECGLVYVDDKLVEFEVKSPKIPQPWLTELPEVSHYQQRGRTCILALISGRDSDAHALMSPSLVQKVTEESFVASMKNVRENLGDVSEESLAESQAVFSPGEPATLELSYPVNGSRTKGVARVKYRFTPWKGELVGVSVDIPE